MIVRELACTQTLSPMLRLLNVIAHISQSFAACVCVYIHALVSVLFVGRFSSVEQNGEVVKKKSLKCSAAPNNLAAEYSILIGGPVIAWGIYEASSTPFRELLLPSIRPV